MHHVHVTPSLTTNLVTNYDNFLWFMNSVRPRHTNFLHNKDLHQTSDTTPSLLSFHLPRETLIHTLSHTHTMFQPVNPKPYLTSLLGHQVVVRLKFSGTEYHGTLKSIDNYMNLLMAADVIELEQTPGTIPDLTKGTKLGSELFVRCNNVLWIGKAETGEQVPAEEHTEAEGTVIEGEKV